MADGDRARMNITEPGQLLVEGKDAMNFFEGMLDYLDIDGVQVHDFGNNRGYKKLLPTFVLMDGFRNVERLGLVCDAEKDVANSTLDSMNDTIEKAWRRFGSGEWPTTSTFVLPDNSRPGMLETLICDSFAHEPISKCIDNYFSCIASHDNEFAPSFKARAFAYIAASKKPNVSVGVAAKASIWKLGDPVFEDLRRFVSAIGGISST